MMQQTSETIATPNKPKYEYTAYANNTPIKSVGSIANNNSKRFPLSSLRPFPQARQLSPAQLASSQVDAGESTPIEA